MKNAFNTLQAEITGRIDCAEFWYNKAVSVSSELYDAMMSAEEDTTITAHEMRKALDDYAKAKYMERQRLDKLNMLKDVYNHLVTAQAELEFLNIL